MYSDTSIRETIHIVMMPFWCFPEVPDGIFSLFLVCGKQSFPPPGESAGNSCENGSLSPVAGWGTGSTGPSRRTRRFHPRGKCREFPRKRFTFPRGEMGHWLHRPLSRHLAFPPPGKVPDFSAKTVHFPPWLAGVPAPQAPLAALGISTSRESAGNFRENGSLSPRGQ